MLILGFSHQAIFKSCHPWYNVLHTSSTYPLTHILPCHCAHGELTHLYVSIKNADHSQHNKSMTIEIFIIIMFNTKNLNVLKQNVIQCP